jgi:RimJ/RimL family protein N-acetyltransferase
MALAARPWHNRPVIEQRADFSVKPTLIGERVVLRPIAAELDAPALREMLQDPEALKLTGSMHGPDEMPEWDVAAEARFWDWYSTRNQQADRLDLAVVDKATGEAVGEVVLNDWNAGNRSCGFRIILGPRGRDGSRAGREAAPRLFSRSLPVTLRDAFSFDFRAFLFWLL